jgi:WD40 repeat protein
MAAMIQAKVRAGLAVLVWSFIVLMPGLAQSSEPVEVFVQMGHLGNVLSAALSPDGRYVLSGGRDGNLKLWSLESGREIRTLTGHLAAVNAVAFSPDSRWILSGSSDTTLRLWNPEDGRTISIFQGHQSVVSAAVFSPDGRTVLSGGLDQLVKVWEVLSGRELLSLKGHTDSVNSVAFSPDGRYLLSGGGDGALRLWEAVSGREIRTMTGPNAGVTRVAFSPDGQYILSGGWDGSLRIWDGATGSEKKNMVAGGAVTSAVFSPDGRRIYSGGLDRAVTVREVDTGRVAGTLTGHGDQVTSVAVSADGGLVLSGSWDNTLKMWDTSTGREIRSFRGLGLEVDSVSLKSGGTLAVSGGGGGAARLWDLARGRGLQVLDGGQEHINAAVFSSDGRSVLTAGGDGTLKIWDAATGQVSRTLAGHLGSVEAAAFTPDGRYVVSGSLDRTVKLWEAGDGREIKTYEGFTDSVDILAISPDSRLVLTEASPQFRMWELTTGREVRAFAGHGPGVETLAFSPDGRLILSGSFDRTAKLWEAKSGQELLTLAGHTDSVEAVAFSPDSRRALTGSWDTTLKLWNLATGQNVRTFTGHTGWVETVAFTGDGSRAVSGGADGTVRLWEVETGRELARLVGLAGGEWIVITPEGYYASSPQGHDALNVRLGNRDFGIGQFYDVFYRPDIVEHKLKGFDIASLVGLTLETALADPPPEVVISPLPESTGDARIKVDYHIESAGGGIGEVRVFHNGKLVRSDGYYRPFKGAAAEAPGLDQEDSSTIYRRLRDLTLDLGINNRLVVEAKGDTFEDGTEIEVASGENTVSVCAFNRNNTVQSRLQSITFSGQRPPEEPNLYVLSVGIDQYAEPRANLKYAAKDAREAAAGLAKAATGEFRPDNIHVEVLTDLKATKAAILERVDGLAKRAGLGDMVVVFLAGHGLLRDEQYCFVTTEYAGQAHDRCLVSSNELVKMSTSFKSLSQLFIFDSCHAGGLDYIINGLYDARLSVLARKLGLHVYASCGSLQSALDGYRGNGLFTHNLLAGLNHNRSVDGNDDQSVTVVELGNYVKARTTDLAREMGLSQTPTIIDFGRDIPVYKLK